MKGPLKRPAAATFFCLAFAALFSCSAAVRHDGSYCPIRVENTAGLRLFLVKCGLRDGDLVVYGKLRRSRLPGPVASAIRISITGLDGNLIAEQSTTYAPRMLSRYRWSDIARFSARFSNVPERGALIRVGGER